MNEPLFQKSIEYVLRSPKTERQVRTWLFKKRKEGEFLDIDAIITKLKDLGYINDLEYATRFAETKQTKLGHRNIKNKLAIKGIAREHIDTLETPDQTDLAKTLAEKYMRGKNRDQKTFQKLYRFLLSKGFDYDTINHVTQKLKGD
jgi:regulatory protein